MSYFFTSESVSEGHPDKVSDQISDAILDEFLAFDPNSKVACETLVTTGLVVIAGEVKSEVYIDVQEIARKVINEIGYTKGEYRFDGNSCGVISAIHEQSPDINQGVEKGQGLHKEEQGAGDQGMMFGYACRDTEDFMPLPLDLSHRILLVLAEIRKEGKQMTYLRPDSKSQVTIEYSADNKPKRVDTIVVSTQHDDFDSDDNRMLNKIKEDVKNILLPRVIKNLDAKTQALFKDDYILHVNPTGKFVIGGPHGDTGLTGRKIIVDTYGGKGAHGGGAFSGKDPSKVDRSAAYAARHIAKNLVAAGLADEILIQLAYAIGVAEPVGIFCNTFGTAKLNITDSEISKKIKQIFSLKPADIEDKFKLRTPIYKETASYGHFGRKPMKITKVFESPYLGTKTIEVELFSWEKLDYIDIIKKEFNL
ncbi:MAG: methionine adenosyltransferase [Bacteroidales bacterium]|jgi:S-adenosylmethionine synthetase|nr:methionine adenosyltransferase [Bacteroidales bacterium]MCK9498793.1 methionine adenosyltransferase [Bacteroidales bacterium]MDY0315794.1 methionine adenosyltransferase [Bacteroidales bacterium]NLB86572.1 methionine adenosyltransferase [Bacteroidales bacterium]